jgi:hypothetical protein
LAESHFPARTWAKLAITEQNGGWSAVEQLPDWYTRSRRVAHPRFGVSVARLEDFLARTAPELAQMNCPSEPASIDDEKHAEG